MTNGDESAERGADVLVAGAGLAGLTAAFGFAQAGFDVVSSGPTERAGPGRTVALLDQSVAFLKSLGLWASLQSQAAPLRALRLLDATGALFPPRPVEFHGVGNRPRRVRLEHRERPDGRNRRRRDRPVWRRRAHFDRGRGL